MVEGALRVQSRSYQLVGFL